MKEQKYHQSIIVLDGIYYKKALIFFYTCYSRKYIINELKFFYYEIKEITSMIIIFGGMLKRIVNYFAMTWSLV